MSATISSGGSKSEIIRSHTKNKSKINLFVFGNAKSDFATTSFPGFYPTRLYVGEKDG